MERHRTAELMDDPSLDPREHRAALRGLDLSNDLLGANRVLFGRVRAIGGNSSSVLDLGAGGCGLLRYIRRREGSGSIRTLIALDRSVSALKIAAGGQYRRVAGDARRIPLPDGAVDVVVSSLLLHHFDDDDVVGILRESARVAARGVVMADLTRSRPAEWVTWLASRLATRSRVFRTDGPRSVRAAYRPDELAALAERAGLCGVNIRRRFPFRMVLSWRKQGGGA